MVSKRVVVYGLMLLFCIWGNQKLQAHTFASDVKVTFSGSFANGPAAISFTLNDKADHVTIRIKSGNTVVHTINAGALNAGANTVNWDGTGNTGNGAYTFEIETSTTGYAEWTQIFDSGDINIFTRGGDVVRNPASPRFGHWLGGSVSGGGYQKGITEWHADGRPATPNQPLLLQAVIGSGQPWHVTTDDEGYIYFSDIINRKIYRANPDLSNLRAIISGVSLPRGLHVRGTGADKTIYFAADTSVFRAKIGTADTFATQPEKVLDAHTYVGDVVLDDLGALYVTLRTMDPADSLDGGLEGFVNAYDISGPLPADGTFYLFSIPLGRPIGLAIDRGANLTSGDDDSIYVSIRQFEDTNTNAGIFKLNPAQGTARRVVDYSVGANRRADLAVDPAGNIVWFENGEEHIYVFSPPGPGKYTTPNPPGQEIKVGTTAVAGRDVTSTPEAFVLYPAHPNPFNPSTKIRFDLANAAPTLLRIFDLSGREIATLVNGHLPPGQHEIIWDARAVPSGVYLYRLETLGFSATRRVMLVK